ncbi:hypothetical protein VTJ04DRAFT_3699 [Mycothermus thermophilus]|uniref:uncharacterized protein n=1 Tax=Humicola insolens TaxID=85995 RepID=UPI0037432070
MRGEARTPSTSSPQPLASISTGCDPATRQWLKHDMHMQTHKGRYLPQYLICPQPYALKALLSAVVFPSGTTLGYPPAFSQPWLSISTNFQPSEDGIIDGIIASVERLCNGKLTLG